MALVYVRYLPEASTVIPHKLFRISLVLLSGSRIRTGNPFEVTLTYVSRSGQGLPKRRGRGVEACRMGQGEGGGRALVYDDGGHGYECFVSCFYLPCLFFCLFAFRSSFDL